jgi:hypothetical protein
MTEFTAPSGVTVVINPAPWKDAKALKKAIEREVDLGALNLSGGFEGVVTAILAVDASDAVDAALAPCLARCLRDGQKIVDATFDDVEARADYYDIVVACIKENLSPLVVSLFSKLSEAGLTMKQAEPSATQS